MRFSTAFFIMSIFLFFGSIAGFASNNTAGFQFISPMPGSENNTRESTIIIRHGEKIDRASLSPASGLIQVTGSVSGQVSGETVLSSDGKTIIFKPQQRFEPDETVTVRMLSGLKTSDGETLPQCEFSFKITPFSEQPNPYNYLDDLKANSRFQKNSGRLKLGKALPAGDFPAMTVNVYDSAAVGDGYIFMAVASETPGIGYYLMILNNDGTPFFARELLSDYAYDFKVQPNGLLSYGQFLEHHSYTGGGDVIHKVMDNSFTIVDSFQMGNGYIAEGHDFHLLPNGHALLFGYYLTRVDMSQYVSGGYPNALVSGGVVQELDADKNVVFQWRSWDYYDFETYPFSGRTVRSPIVSEFHLNTINLDADQNIIIATPRWVKKINRQTGEIMWRLGDFDNEFTFVGIDSATGMDYVGGHMFHRIPNGNFLLYDNGNRPGTKSSKVHEFALDQQSLTAELIWTWEPDTIVGGWHRGDAQRLPNGNTVIGWGGASGDHIPACTEVTPAGQKVYEISFDNPGVESYRAFRFPFPDGQPSANVTINEVSPGTTYNFTQGDTSTGISVKINSLNGSGYNAMTVKKYDYAPMHPEFPGKAPRVKPARMVLSQYNITGIDADVMFDVSEWGIQEPDSTIIYRREFAGSGLFVPLSTTYNPVTQKVIANTDRFGEFILARPDLASLVFTPWPIAPADSGTVNQELPATLEWTPVGYVTHYSLQVALDENFTNLVVDQNNMTDAFYTIDTVMANTAYYWQVKSINDAGESDWTATQMFSTIPPFVSLTVPNGGEMWQRGLEFFIQWDDNIDEDVVLELYDDQTMVSVIDTAESSGAYNWEIPFDLPTGTNYYIQLKSLTNGSLFDMSDNAFSIIDTTSGIIANPDVLVRDYALRQNYPNPFNPETNIEFEIPKASFVELKVYDVKGALVSTLLKKQLVAGRYTVNFSAERLASGIYFYTLHSGEFVQTRKMVVMR